MNKSELNQSDATICSFRITGMDCAGCAQSLEKAVAQLEGVQQSSVNFTTERLQVQGQVQPQYVIARVRAMGYDVADEGTDDAKSAAPESQRPSNF
jgi:Cd2+/Zn2+-exporting ATPase